MLAAALKPDCGLRVKNDITTYKIIQMKEVRL